MLDPKHDPFIEQLKADLAEGVAELDRGEGIPWEDVRARLDAEADARKTKREKQLPQ